MPAPFETMKMKKTTMWTLRSRLLVGAQQRPDQEHRRAGGADEARQQRADAEERGVDQRRARQRAAQVDAARDHEERAEQRDERHVLAQAWCSQCAPSCSDAEQVDDHRQARDQAQHQLVAVVLPEVRERERRDRDGEQVGDERERRPQRRRGQGFGRALRLRVVARGSQVGEAQPIQDALEAWMVAQRVEQRSHAQPHQPRRALLDRALDLVERLLPLAETGVHQRGEELRGVGAAGPIRSCRQRAPSPRRLCRLGRAEAAPSAWPRVAAISGRCLRITSMPSSGRPVSINDLAQRDPRQQLLGDRARAWRAPGSAPPRDRRAKCRTKPRLTLSGTDTGSTASAACISRDGLLEATERRQDVEASAWRAPVWSGWPCQDAAELASRRGPSPSRRSPWTVSQRTLRAPPAPGRSRARAGTAPCRARRRLVAARRRRGRAGCRRRPGRRRPRRTPDPRSIACSKSVIAVAGTRAPSAGSSGSGP